MARRNSTSQRPLRPTSQPAKRQGVPRSPLADKMLADMQLAGLSERTHESYLRAVRKFAQWLRKSPDLATEHELRNYLLHIKNDQQWGANSLKVAYSGLKFFYSRTCPHDQGLMWPGPFWPLDCRDLPFLQPFANPLTPSRMWPGLFGYPSDG